MNKYEQLAEAIKIATNAHAGQFDKGGKPYILHPLHLMNQTLFDVQLATIAVLHDVVEDTNISIEDLREAGMSLRVMYAVFLLTHNDDDTYEEYIDRVCTNIDAIRIKRKDLEHNSHITRLKGIKTKDTERMKKYHKAFMLLTNAKRSFERR